MAVNTLTTIGVTGISEKRRNRVALVHPVKLDFLKIDFKHGGGIIHGRQPFFQSGSILVDYIQGHIKNPGEFGDSKGFRNCTGFQLFLQVTFDSFDGIIDHGLGINGFRG